MSTLPPQIKIDIVAVNKAWSEMIRRTTEYFNAYAEAARKAMSSWLPAISAANEYEIKRMHNLYGRRRKARQRRRRRRG